MNTRLWMGAGLLVAGALGYLTIFRHDKVDFNTQIKPLINKNCIACHGGVKRAGGLSLLFREEAVAPTESGKPAIIPGDAKNSEFIRRLHLTDPEERMPLKGPALKQEDIDLLTRWIDEGAEWGNHWAYTAPQRPAVPGGSFFSGIFDFLSGEKAARPIDRFIDRKLKEEKLEALPQADPTVLIRRVSLDLTGLPPSSKILDSYLKNPTEAAYAQAVDSLLASPHFGEKWAAMWMDLARYADSKGYERDDRRDIWRYRDWLIKAFNTDKPYDQFLVEQMAGDLLPQPTDDQLLATAFHRNTMTNDEGGTNNEEFRTAAVLDRVNTTWEVLNSTTFACVQCHSHPYDPFRHEEYYKFLAFFNNSRDEDTYGDYPRLRHFEGDNEAKLKRLTGWLTTSASPEEKARIIRLLKTWEPHINSLTADKFVNSALADEKWLAMRQNGSARFTRVNLTDKTVLLTKFQSFLPNSFWEIRMDKPDGPLLTRIRLDTTTVKPSRWFAEYTIPATQGVHDLYFSVSSTDKVLKDRPEANIAMWDWFAFQPPFPGEGKPGYDENKALFAELLRTGMPSTPVMQENPADMARETHVFDRGNRLVLGKKVEPDVPHSLPPLPKDAPRNRLGLARWMVSPQHPLTARTAVNRFWEQLFGIGLVETLEDFGTQGFTPSNPELLDYLAVQFSTEWKWDVKRLLKEIVLTQAYQRDSKASAEALERDPANRYFARGPRVRLSSEQIRDQMLAVSGLLSGKLYGPGVMPFQPEGVWASPYNGDSWRLSEGEDRYRRAVYTFWKRTSPYPSMMAFDGASREVCLARRIRTNTPLQALVTLNDPVAVEAARQLSYRMAKESSPEKQIRSGYRAVMIRDIQSAKLAVLLQLYQEALAEYRAKPAAAKELLQDCYGARPAERAALTTVASALLNLDEFIVKE
ncbi:MAG: DUF1553 domain-containing protein [Siphonobacter aquaeclarae]|nr:DUF1553 domain-containing protein [Siphonobacter aquaeclarae]